MITEYQIKLNLQVLIIKIQIIMSATLLIINLTQIIKV
jgi:hypothetical protein